MRWNGAFVYYVAKETAREMVQGKARDAIAYYPRRHGFLYTGLFEPTPHEALGTTPRRQEKHHHRCLVCIVLFPLFFSVDVIKPIQQNEHAAWD